MQKTLIQKNGSFDADSVSSLILKWFLASKDKSTGRKPRKSSAQGVGRSSDLSWQILDELPDGVLLSDSENRILFANKAAKRLLGMTRCRRKQQIDLPSSGIVSVELDGKVRSLEVSSRIIQHLKRTLVLATIRDVTALFAQFEKLNHQCLTDELTGLYNRRGFLRIGHHQGELACREGRRVIVIFADMDGLKGINDLYGHAAGDAAIRDLAYILQSSLRGADIVARIGGDEFVILTTIQQDDCAKALIERLDRQVNAFNREHSREYVLKVSFGVSVVEPHERVDLAEVIKRADLEMYREKEKRRRAS
jgi:two-component system cell cycle response regulator